MTGKERILKAIRHEEPDRVPLNVWFYYGPFNDMLIEKYGSLDAFFDEFEIDMYTAFTPLPEVKGATERRLYTLDELLEVELNDPHDDALFEHVYAAVEHHGRGKNRAVFCQTGAVFETSNRFLRMDNQLMEMALNPEKLGQWYDKLSDWFVAHVEKIAACGVDVIHMSDDWGQNKSMIFSQKFWWEYILPYDKKIVDAIHSHGKYASLHSCGYFMDVVNGCVDMGLDIINPIQTSAGMDPYKVKADIGDKITIYGTLDVRDVLPKYPMDKLEEEVKNLMDGLKPGGGYIFCSAHSVGSDTTVERLEAAYRWAHKYGKY
jgi:uroporphyrinogen decarboxylase